MKPIRTWIVIADGSRARVVRNDGVGKGIKPALTYEFAAPHPKRHKVESDRPGRFLDRGGAGKHAITPRTDHYAMRKRLFTKSVAASIDNAASRKYFDRLILIAPPATLGYLRASLSGSTRERVKAELAKDLTHVPMRLLNKHLAAILAV